MTVSGPISTRPDSDPKSPTILVGSNLTARERQVLFLLVSGHTNKEIAKRLQPIRNGSEEISHQTVAKHIKSIFRKLGVSSRTQAAVYALENGVVNPVKSNALEESS